MKRVFSAYKEVKHLFCNQYVYERELGGHKVLHVLSVPDEARSGNVRYEGLGKHITHPLRSDNTEYLAAVTDAYKHLDSDTPAPSVYYSYRTPIAVAFPEHKVMLISSAHFSPTTGRHAISSWDTPPGWLTISACIDKADATPSRRFIQSTGGTNTITGPQDWVNEKMYRAEQLIEQAATPRIQQKTRDARLASAHAFHLESCELATRFQLPTPTPLDIDLDALRARQKAAAAAEKVKKAEAAAAAEVRRQEKLPEALRSLHDWRNGLPWLTYVDTYLTPVGQQPKTYLRVIGNEVETSRGARIPVADAARAWPLLRRAHDTLHQTPGVLTADNCRVFKFGPYPFQSFDGQTLVVGCHKIDYAELELIAPRVVQLSKETQA